MANPRGFCAGVVRAIDIVNRSLEKYGPPIYVRHEIVHNKYVVESLRKKGARFVNELDEVIVTSSGLSGNILDDMRNSAYSYLEKYSSSKQQLRTYLLKKFIKIGQKTSGKKEVIHLIDLAISSLIDQKILSDKYYSDTKSKAFLRRGYSLNKIRYNLIKKGIDEKYIKLNYLFFGKLII